MIKILILYPPYLDNVGYWRLFRPLDIMQRLYPGAFTLVYKSKDLSFSDIITSHVIITRRPWGESAGGVVELLQTARMPGIDKVVIFDEDDLITHCPREHLLYAESRKKTVLEHYINALKCASAFWFSTPAFLETISPDGHVIPNAILPEELPDEPCPDLGLYGWVGKEVQWHDAVIGGWDWYNENGANELIKQWVFFGTVPPLRHGENAKADPVPYMSNTYSFVNSFKKNPAINMHGINGLWKPLIDCRFNDHKSNINYLLATIGGGYTITNYAGKPGWEYASKEILPYVDACELWAKAKADIVQNYNLYNTARQRAETIFRLLPGFFPDENKEQNG